MRNILILFSLLLLYSCNSSTSKEKKTAIDTITISTKKIEIDSINKEKTLDWEKLEDDVFNAIKSVEESNNTNRKERIVNLAKYSDKVDGAVAEEYSNFAFEYPIENPEKFFTVFMLSDSSFIDKWSRDASMDLDIHLDGENNKDEIVKDIKTKFEDKTKALNVDQKYLSKLFFTRMIYYLNKE